MIYLNLNDLIAAFALHEFAQHQIKGKRIKKELAYLQEYQNPHLTFKKYQLTTYGISFYIEAQHQYKIYDFEVFIDSEYPFNSPKVFYQHEISPYASCQDLLDNLLDGGSWGPSLLLNSIFDKMHLLAKSIFEESLNLSVRYHLNQIYEQDLLNRYKVELFKVDEYTWKYMMKSTAKKVIGLTKQTFLKFSYNQGEKMKLESAIKIKDIKQANASISAGKFKLDIVSSEQAGKNKYYFGGEEADVEKILYFMNPIQVIERKLSKAKQSYKPQELDQAIKDYSDLIEYYSLRDAQKTKTYVNMIQKLIKNNYENAITPDKKIEKMSEDIKT